MKRLLASILLSVLALPASAQTTLEQARQEARALGKQMRADPTLGPSDANVAQVPGYAGTSLPQGQYFDDPDGMAAAGHSGAFTSEPYAVIRHSRPRFSNDEVLETTRRATEIEGNPDPYLGDVSLTGYTAGCQPLPPAAIPNGRYEASCNSGVVVSEQPRSCSIRMVPQVVNTERFFYYGVPASLINRGFADVAYLQGRAAAGICRPAGTVKHVCDAMLEMSVINPTDAWVRQCKRSVTGNATLFSCSPELPTAELGQHRNHLKGTVYVRKEGEVTVTVNRQESGCDTLGQDGTCTLQGADICTEGEETRIIEGVPVTQSCWAWSREYTCRSETPASDCTDLERNPQCRYERDDCLDDPQDGPCRMVSRVFSCELPGEQPGGDTQFVCGGDVYCLNGACETIEREASTEFKDALVALHAIGDAGKQFDPDELTVFSGERETCSKKIFGAANCCSGKGVPLLTPWLCSSAEKQLDEKDDKGLCYKVGSYCSSSVLGVCTTERNAYCCFGSKLSRILQVQGRQQINKPWGRPKSEQCVGFRIEEFQRLDLSQMDFTEVYAEFLEAAKLPDEVETLTDIQAKIQGYYDLHGRQ